jgi:nitrogen fixation protein FixH
MMRGEFTGRRMAIVMITFFGVVIAVNLLMATLATRTFGGTVVDNSYVASQRFNDWLQEAREQSELKWESRMSLDLSGHLVAQNWTPAGPLNGATVEAHASHPLGRAPERPMTMKPVEPGRHRSSEPLPPGRWIIRLSVRRDGHEARYLGELSR